MVEVHISTTVSSSGADDMCKLRQRPVFTRSDNRTVRCCAHIKKSASMTRITASDKKTNHQRSSDAPAPPMRKKSDDDCCAIMTDQKYHHHKHHQDQHQPDDSETIGCSFSSNDDTHNDGNTLVKLLQNTHLTAHQDNQDDDDDIHDDVNVVTLSENGNVKIQMHRHSHRVLPQPSTSFSDYNAQRTLSNNGNIAIIIPTNGCYTNASSTTTRRQEKDEEASRNKEKTAGTRKRHELYRQWKSTRGGSIR